MISSSALRLLFLEVPFYYVAYTGSGSVNLIYYLKRDCRKGGDVHKAEVHDETMRGNSDRLSQGKF